MIDIENTRPPRHHSRPQPDGFPDAVHALDAVRVSFAWLCIPPHPVTLDGRAFPGLPDHPLPLDELAARLRHRSCPVELRDRVWAHLVTRSRVDGGTWTVACAGVALPVLINVAAQLTDRFTGDRGDIDSAILTGFLDGLAKVDLDRPQILVSLRWRAFRAGMTALREALRAPTPHGDRRFTSAPPPPPAGHPDLVLARAVLDGAITAGEAALIGATRLDHLPLADAAAQLGRTYVAIRQARSRAEHRLVAYLTDSHPDHTAGDTAGDTARTGRSRPRDAGPRRGEPATIRDDHPDPGPVLAHDDDPGPPAAAPGPARRTRSRNQARRRARSVTTTHPGHPAGAPPAGADGSHTRSPRAGMSQIGPQPGVGGHHSPTPTPPARPERAVTPTAPGPHGAPSGPHGAPRPGAAHPDPNRTGDAAPSMPDPTTDVPEAC